MFYYTAPLSTAIHVIRVRDSSSLYAPMILLNLLNACLWFFYGLLGDNNNIIIWCPNLVGILLSVAQLVLLILYSNRLKKTDIEKTSHFELLSNDQPIAAGAPGTYMVTSIEVPNPILAAAMEEDLTKASAENGDSGCADMIVDMEMETMEIGGGWRKRSF